MNPMSSNHFPSDAFKSNVYSLSIIKSSLETDFFQTKTNYVFRFQYSLINFLLFNCIFVGLFLKSCLSFSNRIHCVDKYYLCNIFNQECVIGYVRRVSRQIRLNIEGVDMRSSSKLKNIDSKYIRVRMWERFAHLCYMHQGSAVSVTMLLSHLCYMRQGSTVSVATCTLLSDASRPDCGCHRTIHRSLSHSSGATELFRRVSHIRQVPVVAGTELFTRISHMPQIPVVAGMELFTGISHMPQIPVVAATELSLGIPQMH